MFIKFHSQDMAPLHHSIIARAVFPKYAIPLHTLWLHWRSSLVLFPSCSSVHSHPLHNHIQTKYSRLFLEPSAAPSSPPLPLRFSTLPSYLSFIMNFSDVFHLAETFLSGAVGESRLHTAPTIFRHFPWSSWAGWKDQMKDQSGIRVRKVAW